MIAALSAPKHYLSFYFVCDVQNSNFLRCVITQNADSSRDRLLSVTNRKALAPGGTAPKSPTLKYFITLLPVTFSQLDPQLGVGWGKRLLL